MSGRRTYAGLRPEDLTRDLDGRLRQAEASIDAAIEATTDSDRLRHLDAAARHINAGWGRSGVLWEVHPDPAIREAATAELARLGAWRSAALARSDLFGCLEAIDDAALDPARHRELQLWRTTARMSGAHLGATERAELARLLADVVELENAISEGFVADTPVMELSEGLLAALPRDVVDGFEPGDTPGTRRVRVEYATSDEVLTSVQDRSVRERYWRLLQDRARAANTDRMAKLFAARRAIAHLAGFPSWAALRTSLMASGSPDAAAAALDELGAPAHDVARAYIAACEAALGDRLGNDGYRPWDLWIARAALARGLGVDAAAIRPYLPLDAVIGGLFRLTRDVFGIRVEELPERYGWHEDVRTLALFDDATGDRIGTCLWDPFARDGKMAGTNAFMHKLEADPPGSDGRPSPVLTMLVTMFPEPPEDRPLSLSLDDVEALFHEFGHVLDAMIGAPAAGTPDETWEGMDFVEGPAYFLAAWALQPEVLATFARHADTGDPVPADMVAALGHLQALVDIPFLERYHSMGRLDLAVHGPEELDLDAAWRAAWADNPFPEPLGSFTPMPMSSVVGGYDAAFYGIAYSLVVRDQLLGVFDREGWLNPDTGRRYVREMLGPGPFVSALVRMESFVGRPPSSASLVARLRAAVDAASPG